ncbi:MAG: amino acid permease [Bacteroidetes bacterium]|jgi:basic amino acid/polyamine antiporter, APA family|nr:amino acid permease [Bacteroidota bacterium]MDA0864738.1 amino acid permease [Bacteroidota bacterium]HCK06048.1 amino acid permease [Flavobacteriaceae bacterium]
MKKIGLWSSTALVTGNMIGSGIFLLPATLASFGGIGLMGWLYSAMGALLFTLVFRQLSQRLPETIGGPYAYVKLMLGDFWGFLVGWGYWVSIWCTNAAIAVAFVGYLSVFLPEINSNTPLAIGCGLGAIWALSAVNSFSIRTVAWVQKITTVLKLLPILAIGFIGIFYIDWSLINFDNLSGQSDFQAISAVTTLTLFAFLGLESATVASGRTKNAAKTVGRAGMIALGITGVTYILSSVAIFGILPPEVLKDSSAPFADAASVFWGEKAKYIVAAGAIAATLGALNGWLLIQGQIPMASAQDGLFPKIFARVNRHGAPIIGIVISSVLASTVLTFRFSEQLAQVFGFMMNLSTLSVLTPYLMTIISLLLLLKRDPTPNRMMQGVSYLSIAFCLWIIYGCGLEVVAYGGLLVLAGIFIYFTLIKPKK